jgi:hypothetical protein
MEIRALALSSKPDSLRQLICDDLRAGDHHALRLKSAKDRGRSRGWSKVYSVSEGVRGVVNFDWDAVGKILTIRAIAEKGNKPDAILGEFVGYLFERFGMRITTIVNAGKAGK